MRLAIVSLVVCLSACAQEINYAPVLLPVPDQVVELGDNLTFSVTATDPDGDRIVFVADAMPSAAALSSAGVFQWQTTATDGGTHVVIVTATDSGSPALTDSILVNLRVHDPLTENHPPFWFGIPADGTAQVGAMFSASFEAVDPDGDNITFVCPNMPAGAVLNPEPSGPPTITWTPAAGDVGAHTMVIFAIDDGTPSMSVGYLYRIDVAP